VSMLSLAHNPNASFARTRLLASTHPCIQTRVPSWNASSLSHPYHLPAYAQLHDESNRSIALGTRYVCFIFIFHSFLLLTGGIQCYTRPLHHYCDNAGPFGNTTTGGGGKPTLSAPSGVKAECSNRGAV
jgi:hypothetical protein